MNVIASFGNKPYSQIAFSMPIHRVHFQKKIKGKKDVSLRTYATKWFAREDKEQDKETPDSSNMTNPVKYGG